MSDVERARAGDRDAFGRIWMELEGPITRYVARKVDPADVEDLVQETCTKAMSEIAQTQEGLLVRPWLYRIAANTVTDYHRNPDRRAERSLEERTESLHDDLLADPAGEPLDVLTQEEEDLARRHKLRAVLRRMPEGLATVLIYQANGLTYKQIAAEIGKEERDVKRLLDQAKQMARKLWGIKK